MWQQNKSCERGSRTVIYGSLIASRAQCQNPFKLRLFYSCTFWGNINVFKCSQAAQALAKRGLNVVRMFIGLSSGGAGQSLYSTHLQAMYAHNFAFFDLQIGFNEEEMRKQVEQLNGCIILIGQETPASGRPCSLALRLSFCCCVCGF